MYNQWLKLNHLEGQGKGPSGNSHAKNFRGYLITNMYHQWLK